MRAALILIGPLVFIVGLVVWIVLRRRPKPAPAKAYDVYVIHASNEAIAADPVGAIIRGRIEGIERRLSALAEDVSQSEEIIASSKTKIADLNIEKSKLEQALNKLETEA